MTIRMTSFQSANTMPAEDLRLSLTSNLLQTTGVVSSGSFTVTATGTPDMNVHVAAGGALVPGTQTATQGNYGVYSDASVTLAIATANATNPRIDLVVLIVDDTGGGYGAPTGAGTLTANAAQAVVVTGTAAASPSAPATPQNSIVLARVAVAANATSITSGNITDYRQPASALGGVSKTNSFRSPLGSVVNGNAEWQTDVYKLLIGTTNTTGKVPPWNMPWGLEGRTALVNTDQGIAAAFANIAGLSITYTFVANRRYKLRFCGSVGNITGSAQVADMQFYDGTSSIWRGPRLSVGNLSALPYYAEGRYLPGTTGSKTITVQMMATASMGVSGGANGLIAGTSPALFEIEDMGPASNPL